MSKTQNLIQAITNDAKLFDIQISNTQILDDILIITFAKDGCEYDQTFRISCYFNDAGIIEYYHIYNIISLIYCLLYYKTGVFNEKK